MTQTIVEVLLRCLVVLLSLTSLVLVKGDCRSCVGPLAGGRVVVLVVQVVGVVLLLLFGHAELLHVN